MPDKPFYANLADLPSHAHPRAAGITSAAVVADHALLQVIRIEPSTTLGRADSHPFDQTVIVISGQFAITLDEADEYILGPGDLLYVPGDVKHSARVVGDETVVSIQMFAPIREEYLPMAANELVEA